MLLALRSAAGSAVPERDALAEQVAALRDQVASLSWHLRLRDEELEQLRTEATALREAADRHLGTCSPQDRRGHPQGLRARG